MKKLKNLRAGRLLFAVLIVVAVVACNKKEAELTATGDVIYVKKQNGDYPVFGVSYNVQTNKAVNSVSVTLPEGYTLELTQNAENTYLYEKAPGDADFTTSTPIPGDYVFNVEGKDGEALQVFDKQEFYSLGFTKIDSMNFDDDNLWLYLRWEEVDDADAYTVELSKLSGQQIFNGYFVKATEGHEYAISYFHQTGAWSEAPQKDARYNLTINSIKYDEDAGDVIDLFNVQEISKSVQEITWEH